MQNYDTPKVGLLKKRRSGVVSARYEAGVKTSAFGGQLVHRHAERGAGKNGRPTKKAQ